MAHLDLQCRETLRRDRPESNAIAQAAEARMRETVALLVKTDPRRHHPKRGRIAQVFRMGPQRLVESGRHVLPL